MARKAFDYTTAPSRGDGVDRGADYAADAPVEGWYRARRRNGVWRPIAIWYGPPLDPVTGEELDRGWRWNCLYAGRPIDYASVWPGCSKQRIDQTEYDYLMHRLRFAAEHDPRDPFGKANGQVDWLTSTPAF